MSKILRKLVKEEVCKRDAYASKDMISKAICSNSAYIHMCMSEEKDLLELCYILTNENNAPHRNFVK